MNWENVQKFAQFAPDCARCPTPDLRAEGPSAQPLCQKAGRSDTRSDGFLTRDKAAAIAQVSGDGPRCATMAATRQNRPNRTVKDYFPAPVPPHGPAALTAALVWQTVPETSTKRRMVMRQSSPASTRNSS